MPNDPFGLLRNQRPDDIGYFSSSGEWVPLHRPTAASLLTHSGSEGGLAWTAKTAATGIDHGGLAGLTDDDHTQYALLAGRSGGQTLVGGSAAMDNLVLRATSGNGSTALIAFQVGNNGATEAGRFSQSGGLSVNAAVDPGAGVINANTGYRVANAATSGNVLRGNGTNFVSAKLNVEDLDDDAWAGYTPTVTQGGTVTSFTTNTCRWKQVGKTIHASGNLTINDAGTAAGTNVISITLPANWAYPSSVTNLAMGTALLYDASADIAYPASVRLISATAMTLFPTDQVATAYGAGGLALGTLRFTAALATSDQIQFSMTYEAA